MADPLTPVLPPQTNSIDNDMPISEVVSVLTEVKSQTPQTPATPVKPITLPVPLPVVSPTSDSPSETVAPKSPLYEDPDQIKVPGVS